MGRLRPVLRANNHTGDYGALGMNLTTRYVAEAGLVQAGVGREPGPGARGEVPGNAERPHRADLGGIDLPHDSRAGSTRGDMPARPGLNPLRFTTTYVVTRERLAQLRQAMGEINGSRPPPATR